MARDPIDKERRIGLRPWMVKVERKRVNVTRGRYQKTPLIFRGRNTCVWNNTLRIYTFNISLLLVRPEIHSDRILFSKDWIISQHILDPSSRLKRTLSWKIVFKTRMNTPEKIRGNSNGEMREGKNVVIRERNENQTLRFVIYRGIFARYSHSLDVSRRPRPRPSYGDKDRETRRSERASEHEVSTADAREPPGLAGWRPLRTRTLNLAAYGAPSFVLAAVLILFRLFFGRLETFLSFFVQNPKFVTRYVREERNSKLNFKFSRMNIPKTLSENSKIVRYRAHECVRTRVSKNIVLHLINIRSNFELRSWFCKKANLLSNFTEITTLNELTSPPRLISIPATFTIAL